MSSFLILNSINIGAQWARRGIGRAALACFLEKLEKLDTSKISQDIYIILGNNNPSVYKMYLENGFNYFVNEKSSKIFNVEKVHNSQLLERLLNDSSTSFTENDILTSCVMRREPGGKRLYQPYFF